MDDSNKCCDEKTVNSRDFFVVGIGASAGGLDALEHFFTNMPQVSNMAFVVIQHLSPEFKSLMPEILSRNTKMTVQQIQNRMRILPGHVYLNPPKYAVTISNGQFLLMEMEQHNRINNSINTFFESLANDLREKSIGIILSGTGSDGTRGCRSIKEAGGIVISQNVETSKFNGMPKSVISTNICDFILSPNHMPEKLLSYAGHTSLIDKIVDEEHKIEGNTLSLIFKMIIEHYSIDFSIYKQSTVLRCFNRRIRICQMQTLEEYLSYLKDNNEEVDRLYHSLLIGVTRFFRDIDAFHVIKNKVIPEIVGSKADNTIIRVWVAGCSTGEEAYSLAILFKEYMDTAQKNLNVKIFATDIDSKAIEYASAGIYPDSISDDVSLERLNRFFIKKRDVYHVSKYIREMVIFSNHNVINNPPFYRIDLLTCRNLLIYFQPDLQKRILSTFQFALEANGFMFLGSSETAGELREYFSTYEAKWKIYKNIKKRTLYDDYSDVPSGIKTIQTKQPVEEYISRKVWSKWEIEDIYTNLIEECLPPSVLVDEYGELVQICGDVDKYLKVPRGKVHYDIQKMVPIEMATALGTAIRKVRKDKKTITYTNIKVNLDKEQINIDLVVKPLFTKKSGVLILVIFEEVKSIVLHGDYVENFDSISQLHDRISDLEQELRYTKESLQTSIEEIETSSEELQSANEELLVSNEELLSTNEKLQSVNKELMAVNTQYQYKIQELADLNNDMTNYLNSTTIGTIFLDSNLCVRKFTPAITKEINLIEQDIGRPIGHISHYLVNEDLIKDALEVLDNLISIEKEIQSMNDKWYLIKISPFRTNDNVIKGIVISLIDITARKKAEENQQKSKELYEMLVELSPFAILIIQNGKILFSNTAGLNLFLVNSLDDIIEKPINKYLDKNGLEYIFNSDEYTQKNEDTVYPIESRVIRTDDSVVDVEVISMTFLMDGNDSHLLILRDLTYRKLADKLFCDNENRQKLLNEAIALDSLKSDFFSNLSHELRTPLNVIMSTLQLLENKRDISQVKPTDKQGKHYNIMKQNCYRLLRLVNNMIDITKIDSGFYEIRKHNYNIVSLVENVILSVTDFIQSKGIEFTFRKNVEEIVVACDYDSIERIMLNLISNAVKFTDKGGLIKVSIGSKDGEGVIISVKDTGIGIPEDKQEVIFDRFRQVDKSLTRNHEGSGIGLSLVKSIVEMHNGNISVQSEYGIGSEFIIKIPVSLTDEDHALKTTENSHQSNVDKIHIELADIYNLN